MISAKARIDVTHSDELAIVKSVCVQPTRIFRGNCHGDISDSGILPLHKLYVCITWSTWLRVAAKTVIRFYSHLRLDQVCIHSEASSAGHIHFYRSRREYRRNPDKKCEILIKSWGIFMRRIFMFIFQVIKNVSVYNTFESTDFRIFDKFEHTNSLKKFLK